MRISDWSSDVCSSDLEDDANRILDHRSHVLGPTRASHISVLGDDALGIGYRALREVEMMPQNHFGLCPELRLGGGGTFESRRARLGVVEAFGNDDQIRPPCIERFRNLRAENSQEPRSTLRSAKHTVR